MDKQAIRDKFGNDYTADDRTFIMGIDQRFSSHIAHRFQDRMVLETCTGAGFTTIALAGAAKHVFTVEIDQSHQKQAITNSAKAGLIDKVTFVHGNIMDQTVLDNFPSIDSAFLDPDWAVTGPDHNYRFVHSNTQPPADCLFKRIFERTVNIALILPPLIDCSELSDLPVHEREKLFLGKSHELYCLYFGGLIHFPGETEFHIPL